MLRIGVVGYSVAKFDESEAFSLLKEALEEVVYMMLEQSIYRIDREELMIISGLTDLGVPAIAYGLAMEREYQTMGIACSKAKNFECFPCDRVHIVGENWGDESEAFLSAIDVLIRIGGGKQSMAETERAKELGIPCFEKDLELTLPALKNGDS